LRLARQLNGRVGGLFQGRFFRQLPGGGFRAFRGQVHRRRHLEVRGQEGGQPLPGRIFAPRLQAGR